MQPTKPPILITESRQLDSLAATLMGEPLVAVDTESNSLYAYYERVCLIQFSTPDADFLVDPLAIENISVLGKVFASEKIEKVFHAAEYDVMCLKRDFNFAFVNLFDTMLAARILGHNGISLGDILAREFGVRLEKKYQRANWGRRPLPPEMIAYARLDTHYLIPLRNRLFEEFQENQFWPLAQEDFARVCAADETHLNKKETNIWRMRGIRQLTGQQMAVLQELVDYRREQAKVINQPLFKVIGNNTLVELAAFLPKTEGDLSSAVGMTERRIKRHGVAVLRAIQRGLAASPLERPPRPKYNHKFVARLDALRNWRKGKARMMGVESDIIMPRVILDELAYKNPKSDDELARILKNVPWRLEQFGDSLKEVLNSVY
jgi:ribonuclease D